MKKFYRVFLLIIALIFLSTYNPSKFDANLKNWVYKIAMHFEKKELEIEKIEQQKKNLGKVST